MKTKDITELYDISDYHRLECLGDNIKDIFDRADHAMYQVKASNKNGFLFCDEQVKNG